MVEDNDAALRLNRQHSSRGRAMSGAFVGRREELSQLDAALDDAFASRGSLMLLGGEPGIGKTRTIQEFGHAATEAGAEVLWSHCYEEQGAPPYWPWMQIVRAALANSTPEQIETNLGAGAADIAAIIPEVADALPRLQPAPSLEPDQARFRLFDSITAFLKKTAEHRPLALLLDNLHAADRSSLLLLEFLAPELLDARILVVSTYRDIALSRRAPLSYTLAELARVPHCRRTLLRGLPLSEMRRLIAITTGAAPSQRFVADLHAHTEGNPLFITEVLRFLLQRESGALTPERMELARHQRFGIPEGILAVIGKRLDTLSDACVRMLQLAAVIGREFDLAQLALCQPKASHLQTAAWLAEAAAASIVEEVAGAVGRYRFSHALIQGTLLADLPSMQRATLHARFAEAVEADQGERADPVQLAYHFEQAGAVAEPQKLAHYALQAGEQALSAYAWEEARAYFERGLHAVGLALDRDEAAQDEQTAALLFGLGRAQIITMDRRELQQAIGNFRRAFDFYDQASDLRQVVEIAAYPYFFSAGRSTGMDQLIARALNLVPPESRQAGQLLSRYGYVLGLEEGDDQGAQDAFDRALAIADQISDTRLEQRTRTEAARLARYQRRFQESLRQSLRAIDLSRRIDDPHTEVSAHYEASVSLEALGDPEAALQHATAMLALVEQLRRRSWLCTALYQLTGLAYGRGDWPAVQALSDHGLTYAPRDYRLLSRRCLFEYEIGRWAEGEVYLERLLDVMQRVGPGPNSPYMYPTIVIPSIAYLTGDASRVAFAERAAHTILASSASTHIIATFARAGLGLIAALRYDGDGALEQYAFLVLERQTMLLGNLGAVDRILGLLAQAMGDLDMAAEHFEDALTFCRRAAYRPELGWTCCQYAAALRQRQGPDDAELAQALADEAHAIAAELGMPTLQARAAALRNIDDARMAKAPGYPDKLTRREVEVLRLIATGKSNAEVGAELHISLNTVKRHIANIFSKTGVANRAEAATYAVRRDLI